MTGPSEPTDRPGLASAGGDDVPLFADRPAEGDGLLFAPAPTPDRARESSSRPGLSTPDSSRTGQRRRVTAPGSAPVPSGPQPPPGPLPPPGPQPPMSTGGPGSGAAPSGRRRSGHLVGVIDGAVPVETEYHEFRGLPTLVAGTLLVGVLAAGYAVAGAVDTATLLSGTLLGLAVLIGIPRLVLGRSAARPPSAARPRRSSQPGRSPWARPPAPIRFWRRLRLPPTGHPLTVRRFRVRTLGNDVLAGVLSGELSGPELRPGDVVRFRGRGSRDGHLVVCRVEVLAGPAGPMVRRVTARRPVRYLLARVGSYLGYALAALTVLWVAAVVLGLVP